MTEEESVKACLESGINAQKARALILNEQRLRSIEETILQLQRQMLYLIEYMKKEKENVKP
jgi:hypothetical protein